MTTLKEKLDYYFWRIKLLACYWKHDWKVVYTRVCVGGEKDGSYSGKIECQRCFESDYFQGTNK